LQGDQRVQQPQLTEIGEGLCGEQPGGAAWLPVLARASLRRSIAPATDPPSRPTPIAGTARAMPSTPTASDARVMP
jgi:hypothetical protein